jgi:beta-galactosidase
LPHDWGVEQAFDIDLPAKSGKLAWHGIGWYRKSIHIEEDDLSGSVYLQVDGAMSYASVWCNGQLAGGWPYGYNGWHLDLTPYLIPGNNILAIRLDNPEESSRWYQGGGIYRSVNLIKTSRNHIQPWGVCIMTPNVSSDQATIVCTTAVKIDEVQSWDSELRVELFQADDRGIPVGHVLASQSSDHWETDALGHLTNHLHLVLENPLRWDIDSPTRYVAVSRLYVNGLEADQVQTQFGVREIVFTSDDGFHLNGRRVQLKGVCMHHDLGALGGAFNVRACERQLQMLREMGANAIRCAHNPPASQLLDLCDRMGILIIDEFVDTWTVAKKPNGYARLFDDWAEADLRAMIRRDRNHPCIILWSTGNEIREQQIPDKHAISQYLTDIVQEEDASRPVTIGCDFPQAGFNGFQKTLDVFGYNYKPHEYEPFHHANPDLPLYGSETASTCSSRGIYSFDAWKDGAKGQVGFHMNSDDLGAVDWGTTPDREFAYQEQNPHVAGEFVWTGFDYLGEPTPFNDDTTVLANFHTPQLQAKAQEELKQLGKIKVPSRSSYFGIIDLAGFKKDRFYLYQAHWRPDYPMAHILPHWNWPDRIGMVTPVQVYISGDEVELFLNGKTLGRKQRKPYQYRFVWDDVIYEPGTLTAHVYKHGKPWVSATRVTTGPCVGVELEADRNVIQADGDDMSFVTARLIDADGYTVPDANHKITFKLEGAGRLRATDNGDPTDLTTFTSPTRHAFNGLCLAIIQSSRQQMGAMTLHAHIERVGSKTIHLQTVARA